MTRPLGAGPAGASGDSGGVFGTQFNSVTRSDDVATANGPGDPITYLSLGTSGAPIVVPSGKYLLQGTFFFSVGASNTALWSDLFINDTPNPDGAIVEGLGSAGDSTARTISATLDAGTTAPVSLWFDFKFAKNSGTNVVTMKSLTLLFWRLA